MRFSKIKYNGKFVTLAWEDTNPARDLATSLTSAQTPHPDFTAALDAFAGEVLDLLELPLEYGDTLKVTGLSISTQDDGRRGLVVTALKGVKCSPAPLVLNTPHLPEPGEDPNAPALSRYMLALLVNAEIEASLFVAGKRAQGDLFAKAADSAAELLATEGLESITITSGGRSSTFAGTGAR